LKPIEEQASLAIFLVKKGNFLRASSELPQNFLRTSSELPQNFLGTSSELPRNFLRTSVPQEHRRNFFRL
jgi:hypothetical protein